MGSRTSAYESHQPEGRPAGFAQVPLWVWDALSKEAHPIPQRIGPGPKERQASAQAARTDLWNWIGLDQICKDMRWTASGYRALQYQTRLDNETLKASLLRLDRRGMILRHPESRGNRIHTVMLHKRQTEVLEGSELPAGLQTEIGAALKERADELRQKWKATTQGDFTLIFPHALYEALKNLGARLAALPAWLWMFIHRRNHRGVDLSERDLAVVTGIERRNVQYALEILEGTGHLIRVVRGGSAKPRLIPLTNPQLVLENTAQFSKELRGLGLSTKDAESVTSRTQVAMKRLADMRRALPKEMEIFVASPTAQSIEEEQIDSCDPQRHNCAIRDAATVRSTTPQTEKSVRSATPQGPHTIDSLLRDYLRSTSFTAREDEEHFASLQAEGKEDQLAGRWTIWRSYFLAKERWAGATDGEIAAAFAIHLLQLAAIRPDRRIPAIDWAIKNRKEDFSAWRVDRQTPERKEAEQILGDRKKVLAGMSTSARPGEVNPMRLSAQEKAFAKARREEIAAEITQIIRKHESIRERLRKGKHRLAHGLILSALRSKFASSRLEAG